MNNPQANTQAPSFWKFFLEYQTFHALIAAVCGAFFGLLLYAVALSFNSEASLLAHIATGMAMIYMFDTQLLKISVSKQMELLEKRDSKQFFYAFEKEQQKLFSIPILGWFWYKKTPEFFKKFEERYQELKPLKLLEKLEGMEKTPDNLEQFLETASEILELSGNKHSSKLEESIRSFHDEINGRIEKLKAVFFCNTICINAYRSWNQESSRRYWASVQERLTDLIDQNKNININIDKLIRYQDGQLVDLENTIDQLEE